MVLFSSPKEPLNSLLPVSIRSLHPSLVADSFTNLRLDLVLLVTLPISCAVRQELIFRVKIRIKILVIDKILWSPAFLSYHAVSYKERLGDLLVHQKFGNTWCLVT